MKITARSRTPQKISWNVRFRVEPMLLSCVKPYGVDKTVNTGARQLASTESDVELSEASVGESRKTPQDTVETQSSPPRALQPDR
jgi:hypothetical protein